MKELITSPGAPAPASPYSPGIGVGDWIFLAGQGGFDRSGALIGDDAGEQTAQALRNVAALLAEAGASIDDVVSCLVHLSDLADFPSMNAAFGEHFRGTRPVRTTVRADLLGGMKVEITVVAHRGSAAG